jgi:N-acyl homoserine lactone hydrolase
MIRAHLAATLTPDASTHRVFVHTIEHPEGLVLVDTGMIDSTPELDEEWHPMVYPLPSELVERVAVVINTHLHFDHCGGNRLFAGVPIHVQARELADARSEEDYTISAWVDFPGVVYVEHRGDADILPGIRLLATPGHTPGHQAVLVDTGDGSVVIGGDVAYTFKELGEAKTAGQRRVLDLGRPTWLSHVDGAHVPRSTPR